MGNFFRRILAFILGIVFCVTASVGGIIGGSYWAYKNLTLSKIGANDPALGTLPDQTIEDLVDLIIGGANDPQSYTFAELEKKYGLKLEDILSKAGLDIEIVTKDQELNFKALKDISIFTLFDKSGDGINLLLDSLSARALFNFFPDSFLSAGTRAQLSVYSVSDLIQKDETTDKLGIYSALNSAKVGGILPTVFEEKYNQSTHAYEYEVREGKNEALTLVKDMEVGAFIKAFINGDSDILTELNEGGLSSVGDMEITEIISTIVGAFSKDLQETVEKYGQILSGKTVRDLFVLADDGKYAFAIENLFNDIKLGYIFGYKEVDGVWYDGEEPAKGLFSILSDVNLYNIVKAATGDNILDAIVDELGTISVGDVFEQFLGYKQVDGEWVDENGKPMPMILQGLVGISVGQILDSDESILDNIVNTLKDSFGEITAGDILADFVDYEKVDGVWKDESGKDLNPVISGLLDMQIADLIQKEYTIESIIGVFKEAIGDVQVGEILGYTYDGSKQVWTDENGTPVNGYINVLCGMECNNVFDIFLSDYSPTNVVKTFLGDITIGDLMIAVLKYSYDEVNDKWITNKGNDATKGLSELADVKLWQFVGAFDENSPVDLYDVLDGLTFGDFIGEYDEETDSYTVTLDLIPALKGKTLSGVLSTLLNIDIGHLLDATTDDDEYIQLLKDITLGQIAQSVTGYVQNSQGEWLAPDGKDTERLYELLCSIRLSVNDVIRLIQGDLTVTEFLQILFGDIRVGDFAGSALGLHYDAALDTFVDKNGQKTYDLYDFAMNINVNDVISFIESKDILKTTKEFLSPLQIGDLAAPFVGLKQVDADWTFESSGKDVYHILESVFNLYISNIITFVTDIVDGKLYLLDNVEDFFGREDIGYFIEDIVKLPDSNEALNKLLSVVIYDLVSDLIAENADIAQVLLNHFGAWTLDDAIGDLLNDDIRNNKFSQNVLALSTVIVYNDIVKADDIVEGIKKTVLKDSTIGDLVAYGIDKSKFADYPKVVRDILDITLSQIASTIAILVRGEEIPYLKIIDRFCGQEATIGDYLKDLVKLPEDNEALNQVLNVVIYDCASDLLAENADIPQVLLNYFGTWTLDEAFGDLLKDNIRNNRFSQNILALSALTVYNDVIKADDVLDAVKRVVLKDSTVGDLVAYGIDKSKFADYPKILQDVLDITLSQIASTIAILVKGEEIPYLKIIDRFCGKETKIGDYFDFVKVPDNGALNKIFDIVIYDLASDLLAENADIPQVLLDYFGTIRIGDAIGELTGYVEDGELWIRKDNENLRAYTLLEVLYDLEIKTPLQFVLEGKFTTNDIATFVETVLEGNNTIGSLLYDLFGMTYTDGKYYFPNGSRAYRVVAEIFGLDIVEIIKDASGYLTEYAKYDFDDIIQMIGELEGYTYYEGTQTWAEPPILAYVTVGVIGVALYFLANDFLVDILGDMTYYDALGEALDVTVDGDRYVFGKTNTDTPFYNTLMPKKMGETLTTGYDFLGNFKSVLGVGNLLAVFTNYIGEYEVGYVPAETPVSSVATFAVTETANATEEIEWVVKGDFGALISAVYNLTYVGLEQAIKNKTVVDYLIGLFEDVTLNDAVEKFVPAEVAENKLVNNVLTISVGTVYHEFIKGNDILKAVQDNVLNEVKLSTLLEFGVKAEEQEKFPTILKDILGIEINYIINNVKDAIDTKKVYVLDIIADIHGTERTLKELTDFVKMPENAALEKVLAVKLYEMVERFVTEKDKVKVGIELFGTWTLDEAIGNLFEEKVRNNTFSQNILSLSALIVYNDIVKATDKLDAVKKTVLKTATIGDLVAYGIDKSKFADYPKVVQDLLDVTLSQIASTIALLVKGEEIPYLKIIDRFCGKETKIGDYLDFLKLPENEALTKVCSVVIYEFAEAVLAEGANVPEVIIQYFGEWTIGDAVGGALNDEIKNNTLSQNVLALSALNIYNDIVKANDKLQAVQDKVLAGVSLSTLLEYAVTKENQDKFPNIVKDLLAVEINYIIDTTEQIVDTQTVYVSDIVREVCGERTIKEYLDFVKLPENKALDTVTSVVISKLVYDLMLEGSDKVQVLLDAFGTWTIGDAVDTMLNAEIKNNTLSQNVLALSANSIYNDIVKASDVLEAVKTKIFEGVTLSTLVEYAVTKENQDKFPTILKDLLAVKVNYIIDTVKQSIDTQTVYVSDIVKEVCGNRTIREYLDFVKLPDNAALNSVTGVVISKLVYDLMLEGSDKVQVLLDAFVSWRVGDAIGDLIGFVEDGDVWVLEKDSTLQANKLIEIALDIAIKTPIEFLLKGKFTNNDIANFVAQILQGNNTVGSLVYEFLEMTYTNGKYYFPNGNRAYRAMAEVFGIDIVEVIKDASGYFKTYANYNFDDIIQMIGELEGYTYYEESKTWEKQPILAYVTVAAVGVVLYFVANDFLVEILGDTTYYDALGETLNVTVDGDRYVFGDANTDTPFYNTLMPKKIGETLKKGYDYLGTFKNVLSVGNLLSVFTHYLGKYQVSYAPVQAVATFALTETENATEEIEWTVEGNFGAIIAAVYNLTYVGLEQAIKDKTVVDYLIGLFEDVTLNDAVEQFVPAEIAENKLVNNVLTISVGTVYHEFIKGNDILKAVQDNVLNEVKLSTLLEFGVKADKQATFPNAVKDLLAVEINYIIDNVKIAVDTNKLYLLDIIADVIGTETKIGDYLDFLKLPENEALTKVCSVVIYEFVSAVLAEGANVPEVIIEYFGEWTIGDAVGGALKDEIKNNTLTQNVLALSALNIYNDIVKANDKLQAVQDKVLASVTLSTLLEYAVTKENQDKFPTIVKDLLAVEINYIIDTTEQIVDTQTVYVSDIVREVCGNRTIKEYLDFVKLPENKALDTVTSVVISKLVYDLMLEGSDKVQVLLDAFGTWTIGDAVDTMLNAEIKNNTLSQNVLALSALNIYNDIVKANDKLQAVQDKVLAGVSLSTLVEYAVTKENQDKFPTILKDLLAVKVNYIIDTVKQSIDTQTVYVADIVREVCGNRTIREYLDFVKLKNNDVINKVVDVVISKVVLDLFAEGANIVEVLLNHFGTWTVGDVFYNTFNENIENNTLTQNVFALSPLNVYTDIVKASDVLEAIKAKVFAGVTLSTLLEYAMTKEAIDKLPTIIKDVLAVEVNYIIDTVKQSIETQTVYVADIVRAICGNRTVKEYLDFVKLPNNKAVDIATSVVVSRLVYDLMLDGADKVQVLLDAFASWTIGDALSGGSLQKYEDVKLTQNVFALSPKSIYTDIIKADDKLEAVKTKVFDGVTLSTLMEYAVTQEEQNKYPVLVKDLLAVEVNYIIDTVKLTVDTKVIYIGEIVENICGDKTIGDYVKFNAKNAAVDAITSVVISDLVTKLFTDGADKKEVLIDELLTFRVGDLVGDKLGLTEDAGTWTTKKNKTYNILSELMNAQTADVVRFAIGGKYTRNDIADFVGTVIGADSNIGDEIADFFAVKQDDGRYKFKNGNYIYSVMADLFTINVVALIKDAKATWNGWKEGKTTEDWLAYIGEFFGYRYDKETGKWDKTPVLMYAALGGVGVVLYFAANDLLVKICGDITYYELLKDLLNINMDGESYLLGPDQLATPLFDTVLPLKLGDTLKKGYNYKLVLRDVLGIGNAVAMYTSKLKLGNVASLDSEQRWTVSGKYGKIIADIYNINAKEARDAWLKRSDVTFKRYLLNLFADLVVGDVVGPTLKAELNVDEGVWYKDSKKFLNLYNDIMNVNLAEVFEIGYRTVQSSTLNLTNLLKAIFAEDATVEYYFGQILKYSVNENGYLLKKDGTYAIIIAENIFKRNFINFITSTVKAGSSLKTYLTDMLGGARIGDIILSGYRYIDGNWVNVNGEIHAFSDAFAAVEKKVYNIEIASLLNGFDAMATFGDLYVGELLGYTYTLEETTNPETSEIQKTYTWFDKDGTEVTGFNLALAKVKISEFTEVDNPWDLFPDLRIGDALSYSVIVDETTGEYTWFDKKGKQVNPLVNTIASIYVKETNQDNFDLMAHINDVKLGDVMGYTLLNEKWVKDGAEAEPLIQIVASYTIGSIQGNTFATTLMNDINRSIMIKDIFSSIYSSTTKTGFFALLTEEDWNKPIGNLETIISGKMSSLTVADLATLGVIESIDTMRSSAVALTGVDNLIKDTTSDYYGYTWKEGSVTIVDGVITGGTGILVKNGVEYDWTTVVKVKDFINAVFA